MKGKPGYPKNKLDKSTDVMFFSRKSLLCESY